MTTVAPDLDLRPLRPEDLPQVLALLAESLAGGPTGRRTEDFFRWKHVENPFGPSCALVAEHDGRVVGARMLMRWSFRAGGRTVRAARPVDTATHPDMRGRGVFRALTLAALEHLDGDVDLVYNTPNDASLPGYLKMGWQTVGSVPVALRPVHPLRFARAARAARAAGGQTRVLAGVALPRASDVLCGEEPALQALLAEAEAGQAADGRLATPRSLPYLRWRYADVPGLDYRALTAYRGGALAGVAFGRMRTRGPLVELTLSDVVVRPGDRASAQALLRSATRCGADHVATHLPAGTELAAAGRRSGYLHPPRLGMTLAANVRRPLDPDPRRLASWRFALGDLEVF